MTDRRAKGHRISTPALAAVCAALALASPARALPYGVNAHVPDEQVLDALRAAGVEWIRIDFIWAWVEPEQDSFDWQTYDRVVAAARARGLRIFATLAYTPAWATAESPWTGVPRDPLDWYDVCYRAVSRYRGQVEAWGMWNEPNLPRFWQGGRGDYIDRILVPGSRAVRAADPSAKVCGPELAHLQSASWDVWLREVLDRAASFLDVVTHHIYPDGADADSVVRDLVEGGDYPWEPPSVRSVLRDEGWLGRPFWLTESGYEAALGDGAAEARQAGFVSSLLSKLVSTQADVSWVDRVFIYEAADSGFGLLGTRPELARRPAMVAYANAVATLAVEDATFLSATVPGSMRPGESAPVSLVVRNDGTTTWRPGAGHRLEATAEGGAFSVPATGIPVGADVPPGAEAFFVVTLTAPISGVQDGPIGLTWRMSRAGEAFGEERATAVRVSEDSSPAVLLVAGAANQVGLNGTRWRTDLFLHNSGMTLADVAILALPSGQDNSHPRTATLSIPPKSGQRVTDVLATLFGVRGLAALRVESDGGDVRVAARTYTSLGGGTCGQYVPALAPGEASGPNGAIELTGLTRAVDPGAGFRTNVGVINLSAVEVTAEIGLYADGSRYLGRRLADLPPFGVVQLTDVFAAVTGDEVRGGRAVIRTNDAGARLLGYASVVDNRTGDPEFVAPGSLASFGATLASVAHVPGLNATVWRSDLTAFNPGPVAGRIGATMIPAGGGPPLVLDAPLTVGPGETLEVRDLVASLFGVEASGALRLDLLAGEAVIGSRTYNLAPGGTYGQFVPAAGPAAGTTRGVATVLFPVAGSPVRERGFRTNLGLLNLSEVPIDVSVARYRLPGTQLSSLGVRLAPNEWRQLSDVFPAPAGSEEYGFLEIRVLTTGGRVLSYASVVDNVTGDPVFVPGW
ncbi:MAG: beta-galactosidase [Acidobacteriota bacterium]